MIKHKNTTHKKWKKIEILLFSFFLFLVSCQHTQLKKEIRTHASIRAEWMSKLDSLKIEKDKLWDAATIALQSGLPSDMPPEQKKNILTLKNADLVSMFDVFDELDSTIQTQVMYAGEQDQEIAIQMRKVISNIESEEKKMYEALETLERKNKEQSEILRNEILLN